MLSCTPEIMIYGPSLSGRQQQLRFIPIATKSMLHETRQDKNDENKAKGNQRLHDSMYTIRVNCRVSHLRGFSSGHLLKCCAIPALRLPQTVAMQQCQPAISQTIRPIEKTRQLHYMKMDSTAPYAFRCNPLEQTPPPMHLPAPPSSKPNPVPRAPTIAPLCNHSPAARF